MRGFQLSLNQTQKLRLQRALEQLESLSSKSNSNASVAVARHHPRQLRRRRSQVRFRTLIPSRLDGEVVATLCGVVERVNKLVYIRTLRARYKPETGDIIVGRVTEVNPKIPNIYPWIIPVNILR
ncbi:Exosome complex component RRP4-like [Vitis vinifera]|uniref:Exosome complex component RRP4-like n=1 Tax=Vitis vinifera TaxID=29760 RepID=A0A438F478_VITVI|nr:Exosome complex component RRP4-like [Vitis vinifera]